ncbi:hypothetical protein UFOVP71_70 [uncultured Caudovirales phage]|uniref:Uncharacterized protein n=1 Tax=uncultured Caudovirales phage TaxID=2100421 RepID=A0A6J5T9N9_9CAUD|nr:hypothetical protein UFOVP71_70 [uncultured Caudovirales phage]
MATLNSSIPTATLNYAGSGSGPSTTRHAPAYTDQRIVWFKGVDNLLDITISGSDRRPISLLRREVTIVFWDRNKGTTIFRRRAIPTVAENGQARIKVFARDLMTIPSGIYSLGATIIDAEGLETALTWNRAQQAAFDIEVKDEVVPTSRSTNEITTWTDVLGTLVSGAFNGPQYYRKDTSLFTVGVYASNWTGSIIVQGTLDEVVTGNTLWANLKPQDYTTHSLNLVGYTGIDPYNFYAGVRWVRVVKAESPSNAGTLDKVLIRV